MNKVYNKKRVARSLKKLVVSVPPKLNDRQINQVKRLVTRRAELKYHSRTWNGQTFGVGNNYFLDDLTNVAAGTTDTTRIGDKIQLSRIEYQMSLFPLTATSTHTVRVIFFQYKPNDAAQLTSIDGIVDNGATGVIDPWSPYDHDFKTDYTIISDRTYQLNPNQSTIISLGLKKLNVKKVRHDITFDAGATFGGNHIYVAFITNSPIAAPPSVYGRARIYFRDS